MTRVRTVPARHIRPVLHMGPDVQAREPWLYFRLPTNQHEDVTHNFLQETYEWVNELMNDNILALPGVVSLSAMTQLMQNYQSAAYLEVLNKIDIAKTKVVL